MYSSLLILAAAAQPQADPRDIVVTATRAPQPAGEIGQAISVIDRRLIEERQTVSVTDILSQLPGVTVSRNGGPGSFTGLRIRGAESEQTLVLIDGVRVNDPTSPGGGFDFANLLADNVERIEVLRGPNSVPWGSQAIGGVVNIITAAPTERPSFRARAEYGYADTMQAVANGSFTAGPVAASIGTGWFRTDGISAAASSSERDGYERIAGNGRVEVTLTQAVALDLRGYFSHGTTGLDGFPAPRFALADTLDRSEIQELFGYAGLRANLFEGRFANRLAFTLSDVNRDNFTGTAQDPSFLARGRVERFEYQGDLRASDAVRAVFGAERERSRFGDGFDLFRTGIDSLYGQLIVNPVAPLTLTGGVRYDDHRDFGSATTFGANGVLALGKTFVRASYAEGFKAPTLFQLRSAFGNPGLAPEQAKSWDLGVQQSLIDGRLNASATYFSRRTRNQIDFTRCRTDLAICAGGARPFGTYDNIARARADGVELTLELTPVETLRLSAAYSYVDTANRSPGSANFGRKLARRPVSSLALNLDWDAAPGLSFGSTVRQVGDSFDDPANRVRLDGYALVDLRARWAFTERFELYGRVENLFDQAYQTAAGYGSVGRAAYAGVRARF